MLEFHLQPAALIRADMGILPVPPSPRPRSIIAVGAFARWCPRGRALQELRRVMTRLAEGRTLGGIAAELGLQLHQVGEDVGLAPQFVGDHRNTGIANRAALRDRLNWLIQSAMPHRR